MSRINRLEKISNRVSILSHQVNPSRKYLKERIDRLDKIKSEKIYAYIDCDHGYRIYLVVPISELKRLKDLVVIDYRSARKDRARALKEINSMLKNNA